MINMEKYVIISNDRVKVWKQVDIANGEVTYYVTRIDTEKEQILKAIKCKLSDGKAMSDAFDKCLQIYKLLKE